MCLTTPDHFPIYSKVLWGSFTRVTVDYPNNIVHDTPHTMWVRMQILYTVGGKEAKPLYPDLGVQYVHGYKMSTPYLYPSIPLTRNTQCYLYPCSSLNVHCVSPRGPKREWVYVYRVGLQFEKQYQ